MHYGATPRPARPTTERPRRSATVFVGAALSLAVLILLDARRAAPIVRARGASAFAAQDAAGNATHNATHNASEPRGLVILFALLDDVGMNDLVNSTDIAAATPYIHALARDGVALARYYAQACCTPGRAAILTGKYSWRTGMQYGNLFNDSPWGLSPGFELLPQTLQKLDYASHLVGKWDVGYYARDMWPRRRGFDTFFGMLGDAFDWTTHKGNLDYTAWSNKWTDLHEADANAYGYEGNYSTWLWGNRTVALVEAHARDEAARTRGLFVYLGFNAVHDSVSLPGPRAGDRLQRALNARLARPVNASRLEFATALELVDTSLHDVVAALEAAGLYERAVVIVTSDNGAPTSQGGGVNGGSNYPYRGGKMYYYDGGVRVPAYVHSPLIPKPLRGSEFTGLFHATDWLPTLARLAGASAGDVAFADGFDHSAALFGAARGAEPAERRTTVPLLLTYLPVGDGGDGGNGAFVAELAPNTTFKLMLNAPDINWYGPNGATSGACVDGCTGWVDSSTPTYQLYDLGADPYETTNLWNASEYAAVRREMAARFCEAYLDMKPSVYQACNKTVFKSAFQANENYTTAVTDIASLGVYKSEYWSTPTIPNCTFAAFLE